MKRRMYTLTDAATKRIGVRLQESWVENNGLTYDCVIEALKAENADDPHRRVSALIDRLDAVGMSALAAQVGRRCAEELASLRGSVNTLRHALSGIGVSMDDDAC